MKQVRGLIPIGIISAFLCTTFVLLTRFIEGWGVWYSVEENYLLQLDSLLEGKLALTTNLAGMRGDWAWGTAIHQIWGLGTPMLLMPFEVLFRALGEPFSPINLVYLFYLFAAICFVIHTFVQSPLRDLEPTAKLFAAGLLSWIIFFTGGHVGLLAAHFSVYHQAIAFGFLSAVFLLFLTIRIQDSTSPLWLYLLLFWAGFVVNVRATLAAAGVASLILALPVWWKASRRQKVISTLLLAVGPSLQLVTNWIRFRSPFEFGHILCFSGDPDAFHQMRFGAAMNDVSWYTAARELVGLLFFKSIDPFTGHSMIAPIFRNRSLKVWPFDQWDLAVVLLGILSASAILAYSIRRKTFSPRARAAVTLLIWGLTFFIALFAFYTRTHSMFSRYLCDFAAPIVALQIALFLCLLGERPSHRRVWIVLGLGMIATGAQYFAIRIPQTMALRKVDLTDQKRLNASTQSELEKKQLAARARMTQNSDHHLPDFYRCPDPRAVHDPIAGNHFGWDISRNCYVQTASQILLPQAPCYEIVYDVSLAKNEKSMVVPRLHAGREEYRMEHEESSNDLITRRFCSTGSDRWAAPEGFPQIVTIAWIQARHISNENAKFYLGIQLKSIHATPGPKQFGATGKSAPPT